MTELAARYGVHPNLIANWKKKAREQELRRFSENKERQDAALEGELRPASSRPEEEAA